MARVLVLVGNTMKVLPLVLQSFLKFVLVLVLAIGGIGICIANTFL